MDPRIGSWMMEPDENKEMTLGLFQQYCTCINPTRTTLPILSYLFCTPIGNIHRNGAVFLQSPYELGGHEEDGNWNAIHAQDCRLVSQCMLRCIREDWSQIEMKVLPILAKMEFFGVGFDETSSSKLPALLKEKVAYLNTKAFKLCGL